MSVSQTSIIWTDSTWSPTRGCSRVNPDCDSCYAMRQAHRFSGPGKPYEGLTRIGKHGPDWSGVVRLVPEMLDQPLRWREPRRIFVDSMSGLFHPALKNEEIAAVFGVMAATKRHTFQVLTKRPKRMLEWFKWIDREYGPNSLPFGHRYKLVARQQHCLVWAVSELQRRGRSDLQLNASLRAAAVQPGPWPLPNVWIGISAGHQAALDEFVPLLLRCPAALHWVSIEPQLEEVTLREEWLWSAGMLAAPPDRSQRGPIAEHATIGWVVSGGESGPGARPFDLAWARKTRDQCRAAGVAWLFKQGGSACFLDSVPFQTRKKGGKDLAEFPAEFQLQEFPS